MVFNIGAHFFDQLEKVFLFRRRKILQTDRQSIIFFGNYLLVDSLRRGGREQLPMPLVFDAALSGDVTGGNQLLNGFGCGRFIDLQQQRQVVLVDARIFADPGQKNKLSPLQGQLLKTQVVKSVDGPGQCADVAQQFVV